jgi:hypothetical protein
MKKYTKKFVPESRAAELCKGLKWKEKFKLRKQGKEMNTVHLTRHYEECFRQGEERLWEAAFKDEIGKVKFYYNVIYEAWYELDKRGYEEDGKQ